MVKSPASPVNQLKKKLQAKLTPEQISRAQDLAKETSLKTNSEALSVAEVPESVKNIIRERVDDGRAMGMVVGVVNKNGASYFSYGRVAASGDQTPEKDSVFEIGSISKVFTATLLADAVRRGEVSYADPIQTVLPSDVVVHTKDGKSITLEHLSVQNSGVGR